MIKRLIITFSYIFLVVLSAFGGIEQTLADSINSFASRYARTSRIKIEGLELKDKTAIVMASRQLSFLSLDENDVQDLRDMVSRIVFSRTDGYVKIFTDDREIDELITQRNRSARSRQHLYTLSRNDEKLVRNESCVFDSDMGLEGKHIAVYGSHGLYYDQQSERWRFQRAKLFTTVEDLLTSDYVHTYLVPMLENAGAIVLEPRERDTQATEYIVDDCDIYLTNGWERCDSGGYALPERALYEGENPFRDGGYAYSNSTNKKSKELRYIPNIHESGEYAVYVSYKSLANSSDGVSYEVVHCGQRTCFKVNQKMGGGTWIYLGTFKFSSGNGKYNYVSVSNNGMQGSVVTSDAVRFGGGMGCIARYKQADLNDNNVTEVSVSGVPKYIEGSRYWLQYAGIPDSVYNFTSSSNDYTDDFTSRGRWINYLCGGSISNPNPPHGAQNDIGLNIPIHLGLALHTDAGIAPTDSTIGTLVIYTDYNNDMSKEYPNGVSRSSARSYADYVQTQICDDIRQLFDSCWTRRELMNASYSETRNPDVPMIILELLSHQNFADMRLGLDPRFRFAACRAIYKGILRYLHAQYNSDYIVQPLPIQDFNISFENQYDFRLRWNARIDSLETTAVPNYYIVYTRIDDGDWDNGMRTAEPTLLFHGEKGHRYDFKVVAGNAGGISFPSEILSAYRAKKERGKILIVNGFTRVSAPESFIIDSTYAGFIPWSYGVPYNKDLSYIGSQYEFRRDVEWLSDDASGWGASYADHSKNYYVGNTFDYPVMHGMELQKHDISFVSSSVSSVDYISNEFNAVDIILGKQKGAFRQQSLSVDYSIFPYKLRTALREYTNNDGNILVSGAYIGSNMQNDSDKLFLKDVLHVRHVTGNASKNGIINFISTHDNYSLRCEPNKDIIHCENPDGINRADKTGKVIARYNDSGVGAIVFSEDRNKVIVCSMPIESILEFSDLYEKLILHILP